MTTERLTTGLRLDVCIDYLFETSASAERNAFMRDKLLPYLNNGGTLQDSFASIDDFCTELGISNWNYYYTYSNVTTQAQRFYTDVSQVIVHNDDVYFDFKSDANVGIDTFFNHTTSFDTHSAAIAALTATDVTDSELDAVFAEVRIAKFDSAEAFDVDGVPFEKFDELLPDWGNGEINALMTALGPWPLAEAAILVERLIEKHVTQSDNQRSRRLTDEQQAQLLVSAHFIGAIAGPIALDAESALEILERANEIWRGFREDMRTGRYNAQSEDDKISRQEYLETMSQHAVTCLDALADFELDGFEALETALLFPYLTPDEIAGIVRRLPGHPIPLIEELKTLSGLSLADITAILDKTTDPTNTADWDQHFTDYFGGMKDRFLKHRQLAEKTFTAGHDFDYVTPEIAQIVILMESDGKPGQISKATGVHYGPMQIGLDACNTVLPTEISAAECKRRALSDEAWNIKQGMKYLEHCFETLNPTNSFGIAMGNYNGGVGTMISYKKGHMYNFGPLVERDFTAQPLKSETRNYIAQFLYYRRLFASDPGYQAWCVSNSFTT